MVVYELGIGTEGEKEIGLPNFRCPIEVHELGAVWIYGP